MRCALFYENPVSIGFAFIESYRPDDPAVLVPLRRIAGPHLSASFAGAAAAPYTGISRLFLAAIDAAAYPRDWNSAGFGFFDLRGELAATTPLPLSPRHTLTLDARARDLAGSPTGERLLRVGGYVFQPLARQADRPERTAATSTPFLPPGVLFAEPLRGFEDYPFYVDRIGIGSAALPAADHHRPRLGLDAVAVALPVHPAARLRPVRGRRPPTAGRGRRPGTPPRAARCRCAWGSGSSRSPSSTSWRAASPTTRRWCIWYSSGCRSSPPKAAVFLGGIPVWCKIRAMSQPAEERRGGPRIPIEMWVEETTGSERYFRRAGNLSAGGLRLEHTIPLPVGTVVNLTFTLPGDKTPIAISGEIVSAAGPEELRMGVKFVDASPEARAQIDAFLARAGV